MVGCGSSTLPRRGSRIAIAAPGNTLMKNSQRQLMVSVIQPPTVGPSVGASVDTTPRTAGIIARLLPVKSAKPVAKTVGTIAPPTKPCSARNAVLDWGPHAMPPNRLANGEGTAHDVE